jgi:hypothetical protein
MNSIGRHDKIISETEMNIIAMRSEIDTISTMVGANRRRNSSSVLVNNLNRRSR